MRYCRQTLGDRCQFDDAHLSVDGGADVFPVMASSAPELSFQTKTTVPDQAATFNRAVTYGASPVELPENYRSYGAEFLSPYAARLAANPTPMT